MLKSQEIITQRKSVAEKNAMVGRLSLERKLKELSESQSSIKSNYLDVIDRPILKYNTSRPSAEKKIAAETRPTNSKVSTRSHLELSTATVGSSGQVLTRQNKFPPRVFRAQQLSDENAVINGAAARAGKPALLNYYDPHVIEPKVRDHQIVVPVSSLHFNPFSNLPSESAIEDFRSFANSSNPSPQHSHSFEPINMNHLSNEVPTYTQMSKSNSTVPGQFVSDSNAKRFPYSPTAHYTSSVSKSLNYQTWSHTLVPSLPGSRPGSSKRNPNAVTTSTNTANSYLQHVSNPLKHASSSPGLIGEATRRVYGQEQSTQRQFEARRFSNAEILPLAPVNDVENPSSAKELAITNHKPRSKPLVTSDRSTFTSKNVKVSHHGLSKLNARGMKNKIKPSFAYHGISPRQYSSNNSQQIYSGGHVSSIPNQKSRIVMDDSFTVLNSPNKTHHHRPKLEFDKSLSRAHSAKHQKDHVTGAGQILAKPQHKLPSAKKFRINGSARSRQARSTTDSHFGIKNAAPKVPRILLHSAKRQTKNPATSVFTKGPSSKQKSSPSSLSPDDIQTSRKSSDDSGRGTMSSNFGRSCGDGADNPSSEEILADSRFNKSNMDDYLSLKRLPGDGEDDPLEDSTTNINDCDYDENDSELPDEETCDNEFVDEFVDNGSMDNESDLGTAEYCQDDDDSDCVDDNVVTTLDEDCSDDADGLSEGASECSVSTGASQSHGDLHSQSGEIKPAVIKSLFSNCPPVINFATKHEIVEALPSEIRKLLKWKVSSITPIVVRHTVTRSGFKASKKSYDWLGYFGKHMKSSGFRSLREYQKINHFPGSFQLGRKDRLWRNISRMQTRFGKKEFGFVPQSYVLPWDKKLLKNAWDEGGPKQKYIIKPPASARGIGIKVIHKWNQVPTKRPILVQKYLARPYLINGSKFDLRLYVHVTSFDPLRIYLYDDGLVRFATCKYSSSMKHLSNRYMHLTNYSINKKSGDFQQNDDASVCQGHKWSLKALWGYFRDNNIDPDKIWEQMKDIVIKTIISVDQFTNSLVKSNCRRRYCCHELFGFDIMLDDRLRPWVLEVNISPSLHSNSTLDVEIKGPMVRDMFNLAGFLLPNKKQIQANAPVPSAAATGPTSSTVTASSSFSQDKRKQGQEMSPDSRAKHTHFAQHYKQADQQEMISFMLEVLTVNDIRMLVESEDEAARSGDFHRIFPSSNKKYLQYFEQPRYYNYLLYAWEVRFKNQRARALGLLDIFCRKGLHLNFAEMDPGSIPQEHVWSLNSPHRPHPSPRTDPRLLPVVLKSSGSTGCTPYSSGHPLTPVLSPGRIASGYKREALHRTDDVNLTSFGAMEISAKPSPGAFPNRSACLKKEL